MHIIQILPEILSLFSSWNFPLLRFNLLRINFPKHVVSRDFHQTIAQLQVRIYVGKLPTKLARMRNNDVMKLILKKNEIKRSVKKTWQLQLKFKENRACHLSFHGKAWNDAIFWVCIPFPLTHRMMDIKVSEISISTLVR